MTPELSGRDNNPPLSFLTVSVGQDFSYGMAGVACLCHVTSGASEGRLTGWGLKSYEGPSLSYLVADSGS